MPLFSGCIRTASRTHNKGCGYSFVMSLYPRVVLLIATFIAGCSPNLEAQNIPQKEQTQLLTNARAQYYNLRAAGLKSFSCNATVDWDALFTAINGKAIPADDPFMQYLRNSHLSVTSDLSSHADVSWVSTGTPPKDREESAERLTGNLKRALAGFMQSWLPSLNGTLITLSPTSVKSTATGYVIVDASGKNTVELTLDKKLVIHHLSIKSAALSGDMDATYTPSAKGLLLTKLDSTYQESSNGPAMHVVTSVTFQPVESFQLPDELTFFFADTATFKMRLVDCTVQK
jgi:hypothetical protein